MFPACGPLENLPPAHAVQVRLSLLLKGKAHDADFDNWSLPHPSIDGHVCMLGRFSHVQLFVTPWTVAQQAPLSTGFSRQEF